MIQNLLTALGVAALSIQTPNNITHEEPKRAYYDSSAVAEYGTEAGFYNYTDETFYTMTSTGDYPYTAVFTEVSEYPIDLYNSYATVYTIPRLFNNYSSDSDEETNEKVEELNAGGFDIYINGVLQDVQPYYANKGTNGGMYTTNIIQFVCPSALTFSSTDYVWLFDHYTPMSQTIMETAGDATTAAAAVIGSGISGVISLFYNNGITGLGILSLIMAGVALVWFALSLVIKLWRRR